MRAVTSSSFCAVAVAVAVAVGARGCVEIHLDHIILYVYDYIKTPVRDKSL